MSNFEKETWDSFEPLLAEFVKEKSSSIKPDKSKLIKECNVVLQKFIKENYKSIFDTKINFDEASRSWHYNKHKKNSMYRYICTYLNSDASKCCNYTDKFNIYCELHIYSY